jgi:hypothetical protein
VLRIAAVGAAVVIAIAGAATAPGGIVTAE